MALLILVTAWFRKRLFEGIVLGLFGLGIFNLHYWGFGVPFIMAGAWLLVRAYRLSQKLKAGHRQQGEGLRPSAERPALGGRGAPAPEQALHAVDGARSDRRGPSPS